MATLEARCAERDALLAWLTALEDEAAPLEAVALVRARLSLVLDEIGRMKTGDARGISAPATEGR